MRTKVVFVDLGNTLYKYDNETEVETFHRVLSSLGIAKSVDEIKSARTSAEHEGEDLGLFSLYGKIRNDEYWYRWFSLILKHLGIHNKEVSKYVCSKWFDHLNCTLFPEVKRVLLRLKQMGLKIGLLTDASEEEISLILGKADLERCMFDIIVGTDTVKTIKPDPDFFRYALRKLKVKPEETLFVGDSIVSDYEGAENVGMKAVLLDRTGSKTKSYGLKTITSLEEIFEFCI